jgi:hypothetical protein
VVTGGGQGGLELGGGVGPFGEVLTVDGGGEVVPGDRGAAGDGILDEGEPALQAG